MSCESIITILGTVVSGVLIYIVGQVVQEKYIKPMQEYNNIKAEISYLLVYYANIYMNPKVYDSKEKDEAREKASEELRIAAAKLVGFKQRKTFLVKKYNIEKASRNLIGLSNGMYANISGIDKRIEQNQMYESEIFKALNLK